MNMTAKNSGVILTSYSDIQALRADTKRAKEWKRMPQNRQVAIHRGIAGVNDSVQKGSGVIGFFGHCAQFAAGAVNTGGYDDKGTHKAGKTRAHKSTLKPDVRFCTKAFARLYNCAEGAGERLPYFGFRICKCGQDDMKAFAKRKEAVDFIQSKRKVKACKC